MTDFDYGACEVCHLEKGVGVAAVPGVPVSVVYGANCLAANAHPWWVIVANTAACGGDRSHLADWWTEMIEDTCRHLGRTLDEFDRDVADLIASEEDPSR